MIKINRQKAQRDFLGIQNDNWMAAARDLGAHALMLYLYFAANADGYTLALSPAALQEAIGMPRSTYREQFTKLVSKGYLVKTSENTFSFYEVPQPRPAQTNVNTVTTTATSSEECAFATTPHTNAVESRTPENREINNRDIPINNSEINNEKETPPTIIQIPIRTVHIPSPSSTDKNPPKEKKKPYQDFVF